MFTFQISSVGNSNRAQVVTFWLAPKDLLAQEKPVKHLPFTISLKYEGSDVDNGSMQIGDVTSALQGFASAYAKVAARISPLAEHQLRLSSIDHSSFKLLLWSFIVENENHLKVIGTLASGARWVVKIITDVIEAKKILKGLPVPQLAPSITTPGNHNTVVNTSIQIGNLILEPRSAQILLDGLIDDDLARIVQPLESRHIDRATIEASDEEGPIKAEIQAIEKPYFSTTSKQEITTKENFPLEGEFVSLNKDKNRGSFRLRDGSLVKYHFKSDDPGMLYADFAYRGSVRVTCHATFDSSLHPTSLEILDVERLQKPLSFG